MNGSALHELDAVLAPIAAWLGTFAVHSLLACALALAVVARRRAAGEAHEGVLRTALWAPLVSSTMQLVWLGSPWAAVANALAPLAAGSLAPIDAPSSVDFGSGGAGFAGAEFGAANDAPVLAGAPTFELAPPIAASSVPWAALTVFVALTAAAFGLIALCGSAARLQQLLATREPETDARILQRAATLARELGLRQSPRISRSAVLTTPIAFGLVRPEICLPHRAASLDDASLRAMLAHELAHLQRGDAVWMWAFALVQALFPWQLSLAAARRRWTDLVELRCDAIAAARTSATSVARCLVEVAAWLQPAVQKPVTALGMAARRSALRMRVEAALAAPAVPGMKTATRGAIAVLSLATLTFAAPGFGAHAPKLEAADAPVELEPLLLEQEPPEPFDSDVEPPRAVAGAAAAGPALDDLVALLRREHEQLALDANALDAQLAARPSTESELLRAALQRRLLDLAQLRARLEQRVGRRASETR